MKQFIYIFRQSRKVTLSPEQQKQRTADVRAWAMAQIAEGRKLDPRILGEEHYQVTRDDEGVSSSGLNEGSVVAVTFLDAVNLSEAAKVAKTHPGPRYGVSVEVREWSSPQPLAASDAPG
jgi:hypothetical protein